MNNVIKLYKQDEVYIQVDCNNEQAHELHEYLSCYAPNFQFHPKFRNKLWNGKISFFNGIDYKFPIGLLQQFIKFTERYNYDYEIMFDIDELYNEIDEENIDSLIEMLFKNQKIKPREYQKEALTKAIVRKRGVIEAATGSGKSLVIYCLIKALQLLYVDQPINKILLIVPNVSLVEQMFSDFKDYGWSECKKYINILYSGKNIDKSKSILISTWQSVYKRHKSFFDDFNAIIIDECHLSSSVSINKIMKKCTNAQYRLGFTGTLPTRKADCFNIYGYLGPKIFSVKSKYLIEKGVLSNISIVNLILQYPQHERIKHKKCKFHKEVDFINNYNKRNKVFNYIFDKVAENENVLILCQKIDHLKKIKEYLDNNIDKKYNVKIIFHNVSALEREKIRKDVENNGNVVLIGTYATMGTGINIKRLHHVVFASSYKSKIKILQSIGRGLRRHKTKDQIVIWDVVDDLTIKNKNGKFTKNYMIKHFMKRINYYKDQEFNYFNKSLYIEKINIKHRT